MNLVSFLVLLAHKLTMGKLMTPPSSFEEGHVLQNNKELNHDEVYMVYSIRGITWKVDRTHNMEHI